MEGDLRFLVESAAKYRRWTLGMILVALGLVALVLAFYLPGLGGSSSRAEARVVVMCGLAALPLLFALVRVARRPRLEAVLARPEELRGYDARAHEGGIVALVLYTRDGRAIEVPILSKEERAGERALAALLAHAPHLAAAAGGGSP